MNLSSSYASPKPAGGLELWSWVFMRISGLLLLGLALGHLVLMHLIHNVDEISYAFVATRYAGWFWRTYDLLMLILAMLHGMNGARILIDDYVHPVRWRRLALGVLYVGCGGLLALGAGVALFFQPVSH
ncbi:MAG: succinate dehydrogenase [Candidatus Omnitrophica bacterium]|nr:succinate dehydrogenase [Candidatus Omnitrophota bacterium]